MTGRELVLDVLAGRAVPRTPAGPLAVHYCARLAGVSLRRYTTDAATLAECVIRYYERFQPDAIWLSADTWVTAQAMGAPVAFSDGDSPMSGTGEPLVSQPADVDKIPPPDPGSQGRWPMMLDALQRIRRGVGEDVCLVACFDQYPFSLACALMGIETSLMKAFDDPPLLEAVMAKAVDYASAYALSLDRAGADVLSGGDSPAGLLGPELYHKVAWPFACRLVERLKASTVKPVTLHICGSATTVVGDMAATGVDALELDQRVDLTAAARIVGPGVGLWGNLDPVALLAQAAPRQVRQTTMELVRSMRSVGHARFVASSGCTLAVETPAENLDAFFAAVKEGG